MPDIKKLSEPKFLLKIGVAYSIFVSILLLMPSSGVPKINIPYFDKVVHFSIFLLLALIWLLVLLTHKRLNKQGLLLLLLSVFSYGIIVEILQGTFLASRQADVWDMVANTIGIVGGLLLFYKIEKLFK